MLEQGRIEEADEELSLCMYEHLIDATRAAGFTHYEISNFCRPGRHSQHNSAYWHGVPYLGFGPGAHSYDGMRTRRWNLSDLKGYVQAAGSMPPHQSEVLTDDELYDETVMTRLRTSEGLSLDLLTAVGAPTEPIAWRRQSRICVLAVWSRQGAQFVSPGRGYSPQTTS